MSDEFDQKVQCAIGQLWYDSTIYSNLSTLCDDYGNRFIGTESERRARDFLLQKFSDHGLENPRVEPFTYVGWSRGTCDVQMISPISRELAALSLVHAPSTPSGGVDAEVVDVGTGTEDDFRGVSNQLNGRIAMVGSGAPLGEVIHRTTKYGRAREAGAVAFLFYSETPGQFFAEGTVSPAYREAGSLPAVCITYETAQFIKRMLDRGPTRLRIAVENTITPDTESWNIVGEIPGTDPDAGYILAGAHWDGHDLADGAMDDGLGVITILDVARVLSKLRGSLAKTVRFVGFGDEESWICGSTNYVAQHIDELPDCRLMINCDGIGRFGTSRAKIFNPDELVTSIKRIVSEHSLPLPVQKMKWRPGSSDNWPFTIEGVPTMSLSGSRTVAEEMEGRGWIDHTHADTVDKLDPIRSREAAMCLASVIVGAARGSEELAPQTPKEDILRILEETGVKEELRLEGRWHPESVLGN